MGTSFALPASDDNYKKDTHSISDVRQMVIIMHGRTHKASMTLIACGIITASSFRSLFKRRSSGDATSGGNVGAPLASNRAAVPPIAVNSMAWLLESLQLAVVWVLLKIEVL